jgi:two-component system response regulator WspF
MRIAIVNDVLTIAESLRRVVASVPGYEVAWIARHGEEAVRLAAEDRPDVILMDLVMPVMNGVEATRRIMTSSPCAILLVTATVQGNADMVFDAMGHGALDAIDTPVLGADALGPGRDRLVQKIAMIGKLLGHAPPREVTTRVKVAPMAARPPHLPPLVAVGASTGGPRALATIAAGLPADFPGAMVVVQHVDRVFAPGLAAWLDGQVSLEVRLAEPGERPTPRTILLAATNDHLVVRPDLTLGYTRDPVDYPFRPSVDVFFDSLLRCWPERSVAMLLTGMGRDGAAGMARLHQAGWHTIAQREDSCAVYGMPRAAVELGAATEVLPLEGIAAVLAARVSGLARMRGGSW